VELKAYIDPLKRWWWLIVAATLISALSSFIATRGEPPRYQASVTLMVGRSIENPNPTGTELSLTQNLTAAYADIARREPVRNATAAALGIPSLPPYQVNLPPNSNLIEIVVIDTNPQLAQAVANELANQLIRQSPAGVDDERRQAFINQQLDLLETSILDTQNEITRLKEELAQLFSARQIADTRATIAALQDKLTLLQSNYAELLKSTQRGATNTISVFSPASLPRRAIPSNRLSLILLSAGLGFLLSVSGAYLLEYLDNTLKDADDVRATLALPTLAQVAALAFSDGEGELIAARGSPSPALEAYRTLRVNLQFASVDRPLRSILVTSPSPLEGKSLTAANLSVVLAQAGQRVILLDADLHRPRVHDLFGLSNNFGVSNALIQAYANLEDLLQESGVPGLRILTSGPLPPNASSLADSTRMRALLGELLAYADVMVIDTPPVGALADALILATQVDGVLLVVDSGRTRRDLAKRAVESLRQVNAPLLGVLLNRVKTPAMSYYYGYAASDVGSAPPRASRPGRLERLFGMRRSRS
jgi:succinoglycan biosynthesis transport protein ExoP